MGQFIEASALSSLGFLLIGIGLFPDRFQPLSDAIIEIANRIHPSMLRSSPRIQPRTSWGLVALGTVWVAATFVAYLVK